jgi:hypothetical protein
MKEPIIETCNVRIVVRERGKIKKVVEGHNVWTNSGREYSAQRKVLKIDGTPYRADHIDYIGIGNGAYEESVTVNRLHSPLAWDAAAGNFLRLLDRSRTSFPLEPSRTAVRLIRSFSETEISYEGASVEITEAGLFTDGNPAALWTPGTRITSLDEGENQEPVAYHSFEPIVKSPNVELEIIWELRH